MIAWTKNTKLYKTSFLISVIILLFLVKVVFYVNGSELNGDLSFSLSRDFGISFGNYRQGTFTLTGEGVESIVKLTVFFNDVNVYNVSGNPFSWTFNTDDYQDGATTILLKGWTLNDQEYQISESVVFLSSVTGIQLTIIILVVVALLIIIKYGRRIKRRIVAKKPLDFDSH